MNGRICCFSLSFNEESFSFYTVSWTKEAIWQRHFALWEVLITLKKKKVFSFLILFISIKQFSICFLISCLSLFRCNVYFPTGINTVSLFSYLNSTFYYSACAYCTSRPVSLFILTEMGTLSVFLLRNIKLICHSVNLISSIRLEQNQRSLSSKYSWFNITMQQQFDSCSPFLTSSSLQFDKTCIFQYTVGIQ